MFALVLGAAQAHAGANHGLIDVDDYQPLHSDRRAVHVGDPLVVMVAEATSAESSAGTDSRNDAGFRANAFDTVREHKVGFGLGGRDQGLGQTARNGRAFTQVSARVSEVLPHGLLRIAGEHDLIINGEHQRITVTGLVRAEDIEKDNSVMSNRIADARIQIAGQGDVDRARRPRLLTRIRQWLGL